MTEEVEQRAPSPTEVENEAETVYGPGAPADTVNGEEPPRVVAAKGFELIHRDFLVWKVGLGRVDGQGARRAA